MYIYKREGQKVLFDKQKIIDSVMSAYKSVEEDFGSSEFTSLSRHFNTYDINEWCVSELGKMIPNVEDIQDRVEKWLMAKNPKVAKAYILYREKHSESRLTREKIEYITKYSKSNGNAATNSNTDANANSSIKNVASIEPEVFKDNIRLIQRQMMKDKLNELYPEVAKQYIKDIDSRIIYPNDESNSPIQKAYCGAYSTYPLITDGCGGLDGITPTAPNDIQSFSGQITNAVFALSAQTKGAVALGDYIISLNMMVVEEFGNNWYEKLDITICNNHVKDWQKRTIKREIRKGMKQFIFGVNQPQGNRGFQSPFTNLNFFDKYYFEAMFGEFYYPNGTRPEWKAIDTLQRIFIELLRELRLIVPLTFPVTTFALLYDENGYKDKEYEELCAEEWAKGSSHFLYHSNNADSLSSCCRVQNKIDKNYFTSTTGMIGLMTGSVNVITLNINRIIQDWYNSNCWITDDLGDHKFKKESIIQDIRKKESLKTYLINILERIYKYHIAYKTMMYELEELGMITYSTSNYLYIKKLYSTIGILGYYEAAKFLGLDDDTQEYKDFMALILNTISEQNKIHSIHDKKRPFVFNLECVPGENMAVKFYKWDKSDGYYVPEDQNLYNSYFYNPWKEENPLIKLQLHGGDISKASDGGQGCHINLDTHLSKEQYKGLMKAAREYGCNYFTFNVPMTKCLDCNHVVNGPVGKCPKCGSTNIDYYTRVIGFLTPISNWSPERKQEFFERLYGKNKGKYLSNFG